MTTNVINNFTSYESQLYNSIDNFIKTRSYEQKESMINIINGNSRISLRMLDWFVTEYSKKNENFKCVHTSYKEELHIFKKKYFDNFRRYKKFNYKYHENNHVNTTLGQLNFFRWMINNNIIEYITNNFDMVNTQFGDFTHNN